MKSPTLLAGALLGGLAVGGCIGVSAPPPKHGGPTIRKCTTEPAAADDGMIDDFEDGNTAILSQHGRSGYWFKSADPGGSFFGPEDIGPVEGGPKGKLVLHPLGQTSTGDPEEVWGALLGASLGSESGAYDASKYVGISFWAKAAPGKSSTVRFEVADANTHPDGGICTACWNHFGQTISFTTEWKQYVVTFRSLKQEDGWGDPRPPNLDPSKLFAIDWKIKPGNQFEFWLDDVEFLTCD